MQLLCRVVVPEPVERGVSWVGTDDGNVQLTRDGGLTWTNLADRFRDLPAHTWVAHIQLSKFSGGSAFVVTDDHRRGNWTPYVFRTADYGQSWSSIVTGDIRGLVHVLEQDPVEPGLLFAGSEFGLFVSLNGGEHWLKRNHGTPTAPYRALMVRPRD